MARRTLSTAGRILVAGASVSVAGLLAGWMAASDHNAHANQPSSNSSGTSTGDNSGAFNSPDSGAQSSQSPDDGSSVGSNSGGGFQPQTRTGGS